MSRNLLIVFHTQTGHTGRLVAATVAGATSMTSDVTLVCRRALLANVDDLLWCDALLLASPENLGQVSGGMKQFLDLSYYPLLGRSQGLAYGLIVSAGNDGRGAVRDLQRFAAGQRWRLVREPLICRGEVSQVQLADCRELGLYFAAALDARIL